MTIITYRIVEHDGGWAYKLGNAFSETFTTHDQALAAARLVSAEQQVEAVQILSERDEITSGVEDRPSNGFKDTFPASDAVAVSQATHAGGPDDQKK